METIVHAVWTNKINHLVTTWNPYTDWIVLYLCITVKISNPHEILNTSVLLIIAKSMSLMLCVIFL